VKGNTFGQLARQIATQDIDYPRRFKRRGHHRHTGFIAGTPQDFGDFAVVRDDYAWRGGAQNIAEIAMQSLG
jgi:hypothetical protein